MFVYTLYQKRDSFPFFIVRIPHIDSNIPNIFYSPFVRETLKIARLTLFLDFLLKFRELVSRILRQGGKVRKYHSSLKKKINIKETFQNLIMKNLMRDNYLIRQILSNYNIFIMIISYLFIYISTNNLFISFFGWGIRNYNFYFLGTDTPNYNLSHNNRIFNDF